MKRKQRKDIEPCEECGHNRWKAVVKGKAWQCRECGEVREKK
jgi:Zn-finger protein